MFIEKIYLENLASLKGSWTIDFTVPEYENGIFAITGTNGAGKSTIMDAICLALYGRTPRQKSFTKTENEIMTKGANSCAAKVTFRTSKGRFTACWSQKRTVKRNAQNPFSDSKHEFWSEDAQEEMASRKKSDITQFIKESTGLTFEQFTQSAMLAQFKFETFLTAPMAERTKMLETLTGTGVFREIVEECGKILKDKETKVRDLQNQQKGKTLRPSEEMLDWEKQQKNLAQQKQENEAKERQIKLDLHLKERWQKHQEQIQKHENDLKNLNSQLEEFQPCSEILTKALRAQNLMPFEKDLKAAQDAIPARLKDLENLQNRQIELAETEKELLKQKENESSEVQIREKILKDSRPKLQKISELDAARKEIQKREELQKNACQDIQKEIETQTNALRSINQDWQTLNEKCLILKESFSPEERASKYIQTGKHPILEAFADLKTKISAKISEIQNLESLKHEILEKETRKEIQLLQKKQAEEICLADQRKAEELEQKFEELNSRLQQLQNAKFQTDAESQLDENVTSNLYSIENLTNSIAQNLQDSLQLEKEIADHEKNLSEIEQELELSRQTEKELNSQFENVKELLLEQRAFLSYEEARKHLHDGKPCPLCGALEHPFVQNVPENCESKESELEELQQKLTNAQTHIKRLESQESETKIRLIQDQISLQNANENRKTNADSLCKIWSSLFRTLQNRKFQLPNEAKFSSESLSKMLLKTPSDRESAYSEVLSEPVSEGTAASEFLKFKNEKFPEIQTFIQDQLRKKVELRQEQNALFQELSSKLRETEASKKEAQKQVQKSAGELQRLENAVSGTIQILTEKQNELQKRTASHLETAPALKHQISFFLPENSNSANSNSLPASTPTNLQSENSTNSLTELEFSKDFWLNAEEKLEARYNSWKKFHETLNECRILEPKKTNAEQNLNNQKRELEKSAETHTQTLQEFQTNLDEKNAILHELNWSAIHAEHSLPCPPFFLQFSEEFETEKFNPKEAEEELQNLLIQIQEKRNRTEAKLTETQTAAIAVKENLQRTEKDLSTARQTLKNLQTEFQQALQKENFADEKQYQEAKLPQERLQELQTASQNLQKLKNELEGIRKRNEEEAQELQKLEIPACSIEEMREEEKRLQKERDEISSKLGQIRQIFEEQQKIQNELGELANQIHQAEQEAQRWTHLKNTLGSTKAENSKTFINFVQSLTINNLLFYSNQQLKMLNPRYQLMTRTEDPTKLLVVDSMHDEAIRSPKSLSGGETFILSLAMALGLTKIASRNVAINSFFIDEGFGSLSADSLTSALSALKNYRTESQKTGQKLIGIISHVDAVQDEIETIIRLTPYAPHNHSKMEGPGVTAGKSTQTNQT